MTDAPKPLPEEYKFLVDEPKTPADHGWNARCLGASTKQNPYWPFIDRKARQMWFDAYFECDAVLGEEIG